ncbi:MAG: PQQ-dependent sugar dehydrogenase [Sphingomicrobium sp.]
MTKRVIQAGLLLTVAACGTAPTAPANAAIRGVTSTEVARFESPWAMAFLPGSGVPLTTSALVTERGGRLWLIDTKTGARQAVAGVPPVRVAGQGGLGDVVAHPDFAGNQRIYLSFVEAGPNGTSGAAIGYGRLILGQGPPRLDGFRVIWRQNPKVSGDGHFSHRIAFAPDGAMFVTSGERQKFDPAQSLTGNLGKVLRLTAEGQPMPGNPYAGRGGIAAQFWSIGHRNLLGIAFAPDGRLWSSEMGPKGGDEINLIQGGRNYGWPVASNGSNYDGTDIPDHKPGDGFEPPKVWWNPSISPGSLMIYTGNLFPQWRGDALVGALSGQALIRVDISGDAARKAEQWPMGKRIRAVDQGPRGEIYLLEDGSGARLLRLEPGRP